jgi:hypothetical protein
MSAQVSYPTPEHERAALAIVEEFSGLAQVEAVLLVGSCARGKATHDSCLDITVLLRPDLAPEVRAGLDLHWRDVSSAPALQELQRVGKYSHVDLEFCDGRFVPRTRGWTSWPDEFELEIGNTLAYSTPLWDRGEYLPRLKQRWLPYYGDEVRQARLAQTMLFCTNNLDHVPLFVERGLYFQAFYRLAHAFQEFIQALCISRRTYPIAYDKWIREQVVDILGLPELYAELTGVFEIQHLESAEPTAKAACLRGLLQRDVQG